MNFSMNTRSSPKLEQALALRRLEALAHVVLVMSEPHALAAAAGRGLHHHRIADLARDPHRLVGVGDLAEIAGDDVDPGLLAPASSISILSPIAAIAFGGGPMKAMPASSSARAKLVALGQEAVARMHRLGAGRPAGVDDQLGLEIGFRRRRRPEPDALVGQLHMRRARVGVGIDGDGRDPHPPRGADDSAGDLAPVGDQNLLEHQRHGPIGSN